MTLPFIDGVPSERPALLDDSAGTWITYGELGRRSRTWAARFAGPRGLVFVYARNAIDTVAAILGAWAAGHVVAVFDPNLPDPAQYSLESAYRPNWVVGVDRKLFAPNEDRGTLHPELAMLWSTSGSTGSPKLVRLTSAALHTNAMGISDVLGITEDDVAAGQLPLHYSYGWSVLASHLIRGARVRLTDTGVTDRAFWPAMREAGVTHLPGVPFHYQVMIKLGLGRLDLPTLRTMTQAGGALAPELRWEAHRFMSASGGRFFVMYGQTEAAPRMTTLDHDDFAAAPHSVGRPLPGCRIEIRDPDADGTGAVVFHGPNVMHGYCRRREDLARGDDLRGVLHTGDMGKLDEAGRLTLTGRTDRIGKLHGLRVNLDEVEGVAAGLGAGAVTLGEGHLDIHVVSTGEPQADTRLARDIAAGLARRFTLPAVAYAIRIVREIPRTERGKTDYAALRSAP